MTVYVTVPGVSGSHIVNPYNTQANTALAEQIAAQLAALKTDGSLYVHGYSPSLPTVPNGKTGEIAVNSPSGFIDVQAGYTFTAIGPTMQGGNGVPGPFTVSGGGSLFIGDQSVQYYGSAASGTVSIAAGDGSDLFSLPSGTTYDIAFGNGTDTVFANGSGTITGGDGLGTTAGGVAGNIFFVGGPNTANDVNSYGNSDTIVAGAGATTVTSYGANPSILGGTGSLTYFGADAGNPTITGAGGGETLFGGNGQNITYLDGDNATGGGTLLNAGAGNETLNAGGAKVGVQMSIGTGSVDLIGSSGPDTFYGGSGFATITTNGGADTFVFGNVAGHMGGTDIITDFNTSTQSVLLSGVTVASETGSGTSPAVVKLSDGTTITFDGVSNPSLIHFTT